MGQKNPSLLIRLERPSFSLIFFFSVISIVLSGGIVLVSTAGTMNLTNNSRTDVSFHQSGDIERGTKELYSKNSDNLSLIISVESFLNGLREKQEMILIDVRGSKEYATFRIPGSLNVPLFAIKTKNFLKSKPLIVFNEGYSYNDLLQECKKLIKLDFKVSILDGGLYQWRQKKGLLDGNVFAQMGMNKIAPEVVFLKKEFENWVIINVAQSENSESHPLFPKEVHIPYSDKSEHFISQLKSLMSKHIGDPFLSFIIYDENGEQYEKIEKAVKNAEIYNVFYLEGGLEAYRKYNSIQQNKNIAGRSNVVKTVKKCGSCP